MKGSSNKKKSDQLGMPHGTAANRLRKMVLFKLLEEREQNICFQCGEWIFSADTLSIEHKTPWLDSGDPVGLYFDLGNVAFSHLSCNASAARRHEAPHGTLNRYKKKCRCDECKAARAKDSAQQRQRWGRQGKANYLALEARSPSLFNDKPPSSIA